MFYSFARVSAALKLKVDDWQKITIFTGVQLVRKQRELTKTHHPFNEPFRPGLQGQKSSQTLLSFGSELMTTICSGPTT
jgi:hypothetical protein